MMRAGALAAGDQILPDLTRAVGGMTARCRGGAGWLGGLAGRGG